MARLFPLYKEVLKAAHLVCDEEGFIKLVRGKEKNPWFIKGLPAVLPLDAQLMQPKGSTTVFHPLFEFLTRGESDVMAEYRRTVTERLHLSFLALADELLVIAGSQANHQLLTPEQSEFLSYVPEADETMLNNFRALCDAMPLGQNQKAFVSMYLKRGGTLEGKAGHRMAVVTFPLYKQLVEDGEKRAAEMEARKAKAKAKPKDGEKKKDATPAPKIPNETYGVELRAVDREAFIKLFEYMLPGIGNENSYSAISNSNIAPSMSAVMHAVQNIAGPLNDLVDRFKGRLSEAAQIILRVEDGWVPDFANLAPLQAEIRMIPMPDGNEGAPLASKAQLESEAKGNQAPPQPVSRAPEPQVQGQHQQHHEPAQAEEPEHAPAGFRLPPKRPQAAQPVSQVPTYGGQTSAAPNPMAYRAPGAPAPMAGAPMPHPAYATPAPMPVYPAPVPATASPPQGQTSDFHELLRRVPGLAQAAAPMGGPQYGGPVIPQDQPSWAAGGGTQRQMQYDPRYSNQQQAPMGGYPMDYSNKF